MQKSSQKKGRTLSGIGTAVCVIAFIFSSQTRAADAELEKKLEALQREIDLMKSQMKKDSAQPQPVGSGPQVSFGGQYRINAYAVDNDVTGQGNQTAARARIRQNIDLTFDQQFKTHLQMELGHTTDNVDTTNNSTRANNLAIRHAVLDYTAKNGIRGQAGIVPLGDYFGDVLFSSDWNYNPVALALTAPLGQGRVRTFAGSLKKGSETNTTANDLSHYQLDYVLPLSAKNQINVGISFLKAADNTARPSRHTHSNFGLGGQFSFSDELTLNTFVLASQTDKALLAPGARDGRGSAAKLELNGKLGPGNFGLLGTYASGKSDGSGFLPVEALARTNGYWGYTGILTIQGPTDTGFDGDSVNISNNGYGLSTLQAKYAFPITQDLSGYVAAGWFGGVKAPAGRSNNAGTDFLLMGTYRFNKYLALDFGGAYAKLKDSVSGYSNGAIGGASFNQAPGVSRTKSALFTRLQAEF